ncbi:hypothetical protein [Spongiactinospora rosea]|uniref:hypothetical protein n=1 Tax=Spongiactinospora rosea TaxID=2248750 RepID=UPI0011C07CBB|nr:hypothetical protein [Spongiactinospora rosea]
MDEGELERLARLAVEYRRSGCDIAEIIELFIDNHPSLQSKPLSLARVLRSAFGLSVHDLHYVTAWLQGDISLEALAGHLQVGGSGPWGR